MRDLRALIVTGTVLRTFPRRVRQTLVSRQAACGARDSCNMREMRGDDRDAICM